MRGTHESPLVRFLRDPWHALMHALAALAHATVHVLPIGLALCACVAAVFAVRFLLARVREQRLAHGARLLQLAVPPELDADGALLLWSALHDLLRPRLARMLGGQPQLAWEIAADRGGSRFRLWLPAAVPPGLVERALASAWPGITTTPLEQAAPSETDVDDEANG